MYSLPPNHIDDAESFIETTPITDHGICLLIHKLPFLPSHLIEKIYDKANTYYEKVGKGNPPFSQPKKRLLTEAFFQHQSTPDHIIEKICSHQLEWVDFNTEYMNRYNTSIKRIVYISSNPNFSEELKHVSRNILKKMETASLIRYLTINQSLTSDNNTDWGSLPRDVIELIILEG